MEYPSEVRLGCSECDIEEFDGINLSELEDCIQSGWENISKVQSYEESMKSYDNPEDAPPGFSVLSWWTHLGVCPGCAADRN